MKKVEVEVDVDLKNGVSEVDKLVASMKELTDEMKDASSGTKDLGDDLDKAGTAGKDGLGKVATGFKGVGGAIKAAGIGLVIGLFVALKEVLEKQQPVLDLLDSTFTAIGIAITQVTSSVKSSGSEFSALGTIMGDILTLVLTPFKVQFYAIKGGLIAAQLAWEQSFFGGQDADKIAELQASLKEVGDDLIDIKDGAVEAALSIKDNIGEAVDEIGVAAKAVTTAITDLDVAAIASAAARTTALKNEALIAEAINKKKFEAYDREAELLRQQRDDINLSAEARLEANAKLAIVLDEQEKIMLRNAQISIDAAKAELAANANTENRVALIEAETEAEAIRAALAGKRSEQLVNDASIRKEILDTEIANQAAIDATEKEAKDKKAEEDIQRDKDTAEKIKEAKDERDAIEKESIGAAKEAADELAGEILATIEEERNAKLQKDLEEIDIKSNAELTALDAKYAAELAGAKGDEKAIKAINARKEKEEFAIKLKAFNDAEKLNKASFESTKKMQLALAAADAAKAVVTSLAYAPVAIGPLPNPAGIASLALVAASSALNIGKIAASSYEGGAAPVASAPVLTIPASTPASQPGLNTDTIGSSQSTEGVGTELVGSGAGINQIVRAVVVESDITTTQNNILGYEEASEIGG